MLAIIGMFLSPALMTLCWDKQHTKAVSPRQYALRYILSALVINYICMCTVALPVFNWDFLTDDGLISATGVFYLLLSALLAVAIPAAVRFFQTHGPGPLQRMEHFPYWRAVFACVAAVFFAMHFSRAFNNNFWGDEAYTIRLAKMTFPEMLAATGNDVHPPLYYLMVQLVCAVMGQNAVAYQTASLLPYAITLIVALSLVWNRFGREAGVLLILLSSLLESAIVYNVEVRMYSWGALFIFLSFFALHGILTQNRTKDYVLFTLFSLGAAYTHYFCLIAVAFFYAALLLLSFFRRKEYLRKVLITCGVTIAVYLPWFFVLLKSFLTTSGDFWITEIPTVNQNLLYLFDSAVSRSVFLLFAAVLAGWFLKVSGVLVAEKDASGHTKLSVQLKRFHLTGEAIWILAGLFSIFGVIAVGTAVSVLIRPMYLLRYLYPVTIVAWFLLSVCVAKAGGRRIYCAVIVLALLICGIPNYAQIVSEEWDDCTRLNATLAATQDKLSPEDMIISNLSHVSWTIAEVYYPGIPAMDYHDDILPTLDHGRTYWMFSSHPIYDGLINQLTDQGFSYETVIEGGNLGTNNINVYKVCSTRGA